MARRSSDLSCQWDNVLHLLECARRYGSDNKTKRLVGLVVTNVNKPTSTGIASWFVRVRFHLGGGHTKLHELSVRPVKKDPTTLIHEEEHDIPDAVPIYGRLRVDTIAVQVDKEKFKRSTMEANLPLLLSLIHIILYNFPSLLIINKWQKHSPCFLQKTN